MTAKDKDKSNIYYHKYKKYKTKYKNLKKQNKIRPVKLPIKVLKKRFPHKKGIDMNKLETTNVSIYSMSNNKSSKLLVDIIKKYFDSNIIVTDSTANIGSDTIMLALHFKNINAVELSDITCKMLQNNINVYKLKNVRVYCDSVNNIVNKLKQDVVYVDPPWGGPEYKKHDRLKLYLDDLELSDFFIKHASLAKLFIFRVPFNYDFIHFFNKAKANSYEVYSYKENGKVKYYYLVVSLKKD